MPSRRVAKRQPWPKARRLSQPKRHVIFAVSSSLRVRRAERSVSFSRSPPWAPSSSSIWRIPKGRKNVPKPSLPPVPHLWRKGIVEHRGWPARSQDLNPIENILVILHEEPVGFLPPEWQPFIDMLERYFRRRVGRRIARNGGNAL